jgi:hypothetical protein
MVEYLHVFVGRDQISAKGIVKLGAIADIYMLKAAADVQNTPGCTIQPQVPQDATKSQQVTQHAAALSRLHLLHSLLDLGWGNLGAG